VTKPSRSQLDKAGRVLSDNTREYDETSLELDLVFEEFRKQHLKPLTELTLSLQNWLSNYEKSYYIAQRLKRKPQILRKLRRLTGRLTQLQDIGGCRIIIESNDDVNELIRFIEERLGTEAGYKVIRKTDYRDRGRDITGYRAYHFILEVEGYFLELQLRSKIQHYWSESIERTSVIYGHHLKEQEGDQVVIEYFRSFSDALHALEIGRRLSAPEEMALAGARIRSEEVISRSDQNKILGGFVNDDIVKVLAEKESQYPVGLKNWILVFDWNTGNFVTWDVVSRDPDEAVAAYQRYEAQFLSEDKFEVVMIGSSDVSTVKHTHSHYFGIEHHNAALEDMNSSIIGISQRMEMDIGARRILTTMARRRFWGKKTIAASTLKNHLCKDVFTFDQSLSALEEKGFLLKGSEGDTVSLNIKKTVEIHEYL
jgi:ppGpp synthetase/RelA/SpoT-type nucleotidyltranferase